MRQIIRESEIEYWHEYQNQTVEVLWESSEKLADGKWRLHGLSENYLPISLLSEEDRHNQFDEVMITGIQDEYLEAVFTSM